MNRIDEKFKQLKAENKKALIPYVTTGTPNIKRTEEIILAVEKAGADLVEMGIPYSDPLADGPIIEESGLWSLNHGFKLSKAFECVKNIRKQSEIPIVFMVYYNTIFGYGREKFIKECVDCGVDGFIIPDLPLEEQDEIESYLEGTNIYLISLVAITSKNRVPLIAKQAKGFIYCISSLGVTGIRSQFNDDVIDFLKEVKAHTDLPTCIGFGISKKEDIIKFESYVDGCVVGSALVKTILETNGDIEQAKQLIENLR